MKKNLLKIAGILFLSGLISGIAACEDRPYNFIRENHGYWGEDRYDPFANGNHHTNNNGGEGGGGKTSNPTSSNSKENNQSQNGNQSANSNGGNSNSGGQYLTDYNYLKVLDDASGKYVAKIAATRSCKDENILVPPSVKDTEGNELKVISDYNNGFTALENAQTITLPDGFEEIAVGFANCMKLTKVVVPSSVKKIGASILTNCLAFKTLEFKGSKSQWDAIDKNDNWNYYAVEFTVQCSDGNITIPKWVDPDE